MVIFLLAGFWLAFGIDGYQLGSASTIALQDPLNLQVTHSLGGWMNNYHQYPWLWPAPLLGFLGAMGTIVFAHQRHAFSAFMSSCVSLLGVLGTMGFTLFPFIMVSSTHPEQSLIAWNSTSSQLSLTGILI